MAVQWLQENDLGLCSVGCSAVVFLGRFDCQIGQCQGLGVNLNPRRLRDIAMGAWEDLFKLMISLGIHRVIERIALEGWIAVEFLGRGLY